MNMFLIVYFINISSSLINHDSFNIPRDNLVNFYYKILVTLHSSTSRLPSGLKPGFVPVRLLRWRVRIPPESWKSVSCECCVLSGRVLGVGWSLVQWSPTDCVVLSVTENCEHGGRPGPIGADDPWKKYGVFILPTFIMVTFDTGTNFPAVSCNALFAVAMMNNRHRWNGIAVPTQSHPNAASLTLSAWNISQLMFQFLFNCPVWFLGTLTNIYHL